MLPKSKKVLITTPNIHKGKKFEKPATPLTLKQF